ncbi:hypothetical protein ACLESO_29970 [Pyxidicoccus sp. 3LG]
MPENVSSPWSLVSASTTTVLTTCEVLSPLDRMMEPAGVASSVPFARAAGRPSGLTTRKFILPSSFASVMGPKLALPLLMGTLPADEGTVELARSVA